MVSISYGESAPPAPVLCWDFDAVLLTYRLLETLPELGLT